MTEKNQNGGLLDRKKCEVYEKSDLSSSTVLHNAQPQKTPLAQGSIFLWLFFKPASNSLRRHVLENSKHLICEDKLNEQNWFIFYLFIFYLFFFIYLFIYFIF